MSLPDVALILDPMKDDFLSDPYSAYAEVPGQPVFSPRIGGWLLSSYQAVRHVLNDANFHSGYSLRAASSPKLASCPVTRDSQARWLMFNDGPGHTGLRALIATAIGQVVATAAEPVSNAADTFARQCRERAAFDVVTDFAQPTTCAVLSWVFGISHQEARDVLANVDTMASALGPNISPDRWIVGETACTSLRDFFSELLRHHCRTPLLSALRDVVEAGIAAQEDAIANCVFFANAASDASTNATSSTLLVLSTMPDVAAQLASGLVCVPDIVEETLRWEPPVQIAPIRTAYEPVMIEGVQIEPGQILHPLIGRANRDASVFPHAAQFMPQRTGVAPICTFGGGRHRCLGAKLARIHVCLAVDALLKYGNVVQISPPVYRRSLTFRSLASLQVSWA